MKKQKSSVSVISTSDLDQKELDKNEAFKIEGKDSFKKSLSKNSINEMSIIHEDHLSMNSESKMYFSDVNQTEEVRQSLPDVIS